MGAKEGGGGRRACALLIDFEYLLLLLRHRGTYYSDKLFYALKRKKKRLHTFTFRRRRPVRNVIILLFSRPNGLVISSVTCNRNDEFHYFPYSLIIFYCWIPRRNSVYSILIAIGSSVQFYRLCPMIFLIRSSSISTPKTRKKNYTQGPAAVSPKRNSIINLETKWARYFSYLFVFVLV